MLSSTPMRLPISLKQTAGLRQNQVFLVYFLLYKNYQLLAS
jgi:hypothetical protein